MKYIRERIILWLITNHFNELEEFIIGYGNCGLCGKVIRNEIFPKRWPWGICEEHKGE